MAETRGYRRVRNVTGVMYVGHVRGGKRLKVRKEERSPRTRKRERDAEVEQKRNEDSMLLQREKREEADSCLNDENRRRNQR